MDFPRTLRDEPWVDGENEAHVVKSLWMWEGKALTLCDGRRTGYRCVPLQTESNRAQVRMLEQARGISEPSIFVTVYQSSPKADKIDSVMQKAVEYGACRVVPVLSARCVSRPNEKAVRREAERWQKTALEATKQSDRGIMSKVAETAPYAKAVEQIAADGGRLLFFYEGGGQSLRSLGLENEERTSLFIEPEGGFAQDEVELTRQNGTQVATLGPRIFRTETAPVAALSVLMVLTGDTEQDTVWEE